MEKQMINPRRHIGQYPGATSGNSFVPLHGKTSSTELLTPAGQEDAQSSLSPPSQEPDPEVPQGERRPGGQWQCVRMGLEPLLGAPCQAPICSLQCETVHTSTVFPRPWAWHRPHRGCSRNSSLHECRGLATLRSSTYSEKPKL